MRLSHNESLVQSKDESEKAVINTKVADIEPHMGIQNLLILKYNYQL